MTYERYRTWRDQPITEAPQLSVVVPAYNESERILPTIGAFASHISATGRPWELIVSDDGSKDGTPELLEALELANLRVVRAPANQGKGAAVRRGVMAARGGMILFADADNSTPIEQVDVLIDAIERGADVAIGSRAADGAQEMNRSLLRRTMSGGIRFLARRTLSLSVKDTQCGFKLLRADVARDVFSRTTIDGFSFDLEVLFLATKAGYRIAEVPVEWIDAPGSKVDVKKEAQRFLRDLAIIRGNDLRGRYDHPAAETPGVAA
ncbi:MAG: dolichyl-phosphate beta-glucosyltransferase [Chloroflexota bacterium]